MTSPAFLPPASGGVLVASPSAQVRDRVLQKLKPQRGPVHVASGGAEALAKLETGNWQMLFLDRELPDLDAEELVEIIERRYPEIRVVLMDSGLDDSAKLPGRANDWKPDVSPPACAMPSLVESKSEPLPGMVGDAEPMRRVYRMVRLVARAIHPLSGRTANHFSVLNCAAIPEKLVESELFGYARGHLLQRCRLMLDGFTRRREGRSSWMKLASFP